MIDILSSSCEIALRWLAHALLYGYSTLTPEMAMFYNYHLPSSEGNELSCEQEKHAGQKHGHSFYIVYDRLAEP